MGVGVPEVLVEGGAHQVADQEVSGFVVWLQLVLLVVRTHR